MFSYMVINILMWCILPISCDVMPDISHCNMKQLKMSTKSCGRGIY